MKRFIRPKLVVVTRKNGTCCSELCSFHRCIYPALSTTPSGMRCVVFGVLTMNAGVAKRAKKCVES